MQRTFYSTACVLCGLAVVLGAFGAHTLKEKLTPELLASFETGVRYQFYHGLALLMIAFFSKDVKNKFVQWAGISFIAGVILFSVSIYLLSIRDIIGMTNYKWLGPVTPLGGLCFISGWIFLFIGLRKRN